MREPAISAARQRGAGQLQPTSERGRADAHRLHEGLGFRAAHAGTKMLRTGSSRPFAARRRGGRPHSAVSANRSSKRRSILGGSRLDTSPP